MPARAKKLGPASVRGCVIRTLLAAVVLWTASAGGATTVAASYAYDYARVLQLRPPRKACPWRRRVAMTRPVDLSVSDGVQVLVSLAGEDAGTTITTAGGKTIDDREPPLQPDLPRPLARRPGRVAAG